MKKHKSDKVALKAITILASLGVATTTSGAGSSHAEDKSTFALDTRVGAVSNSNVSVDELDTNTSIGDSARLFDLGLSYALAPTENTSFDIGYDYSQTAYQTLDEFDLRTHLLTTGAARDFEFAKGGLAYRYAATSLGGEDFLTLQQFSPYLTRFFGKKVFARIAYTRSNKDLADRNDKDADADSIETDVYYFINGVKTYFAAGYKFKDETATDSEHDYGSHRVKLSFVKKFPFFNHWGKFRIGCRYEERDYDNISPAIAEKRRDHRLEWLTSLELPINSDFYTTLAYEYGDYSSNLESSDYWKDEVSFLVGYRY